MKLKILQPKTETGSRVKAGIFLDGKMGFSKAASELLKVDKEKYIQIAINEEDKRDTNLYVSVLNSASENSIKAHKAGNYYYFKTKSILDELEIDYKNKKIIYDIVQIEYQGKILFKFIRRELDRKKLKK